VRSLRGTCKLYVNTTSSTKSVITYLDLLPGNLHDEESSARTQEINTKDKRTTSKGIVDTFKPRFARRCMYCFNGPGV
jgi:hypothetical protein